jgi:hypothetical protein
MRFASLLLPALGCALLAWSAPSPAQWAWRDAAGRMVYSDQPPPKSVPTKSIVRQPAATQRLSALERPADTAAEAATPVQARPAQPRPQDKADREIEAKLRQQQLAEAQKKAADEEARQAKIAENCERLRAYQRTLDGGFRVARVNAAGQKEIMDDATRAAERARTRAEIEQHCQ